MTRAQVIESELRRMWDQRGALVPADVVAEARNPDHPLHQEFEWDDSRAGEEYRRMQAASLIRSVKLRVTTERDGEVRDFNVRAWLAGRFAGDETVPPRSYVPSDQVMRPDLRASMIRQMMREMRALKTRYGQMAEFWEQLDELRSSQEPGQQAS